MFRNAAKAVKRATATSKKAAMPVKKVCVKKAEPKIQFLEQNCARSEKGFRLIKQEVRLLYELDRTTFPKRPLFDENLKCRQPLLGFDVFGLARLRKAEHLSLEELIARSPKFFAWSLATRSRKIWSRTVYQRIEGIRSQLLKSQRAPWLQFVSEIAEMPASA